jgi:hypothetical protein
VTLDEQLKRLEDDVRRLKIEFDVFFNGGTKRAPFETKSRVESLIKRLSEDRSMKFSQRFYYNTIVARYVSLRELWRRTFQEKEEGSPRGRMMSATAPVREEAHGFQSVQIAFASGQEVEDTKRLYEYLVEAKNQCGEINNVSFDQFQRLIATRTVQLREKTHCQKVAYEIAVEDGLVKFKARPVL